MPDYPVDFEQEKNWWNHKAHKEELDQQDEDINRRLRWRALEACLAGVSAILDVGAATGAFSIPLAQRGYQVTHLDLSPAMLAIARQRAAGLENITFIEGNAADLSRFPDHSFDLVLNTDGAISFCGSQAEQTLAECCRVTAGRLLVTVSHRAHLAPIWLENSLMTLGRFSEAGLLMLREGSWHQEQFPENYHLSQGATLGYMGALRAFLPGELRALIKAAGLRVLRCGGLGSLAAHFEPASLARLRQNPALMDQFLDLCEEYDRQVEPEGPGTGQRAGLIAVAER